MRVARLAPMFCIMGAIFFLSHQPGDTFIMPPIVGLDKLVHMIVYGVLAGTMIWAFNYPGTNYSPVKLALATIILCTLYGVSDELHQKFVPGRYPSPYDVVADGLGAVIVSLLWLRRAKDRILTS